MAHPYTRPLHNKIQIEEFIQIVLQDDRYQNDALLADIYQQELGLKAIQENTTTLISPDVRQRKFRLDADRWRLRKDIADELYTQLRRKNDDEIVLGPEGGGARPHAEMRLEGKAFIVTGLPASGKSGVSDAIAEHFGAVILDSDYAKRKLPEFQHNPAAVSLVHDESDGIIFGFGRPQPGFIPLIELFYAAHQKVNMVLPKIGHSPASVVKLAKSMQSMGYEVHLTLVSLDRKDATLRALSRFERSKRYVPLSLIFDGYANEPILTYYRLKNLPAYKGIFTSFGKVSTAKREMEVVDIEDGNPAHIFLKNA